MKRLITPENNVKLALELRRGRWLVHDISTLIPTAISLLQQQDILLQAAEREFDIMLYDVDARAVSANAARSGDPCVAVIPISGTITKYDSCGTIGTATYAQALLAAAADTNVVACVLDIDSGGGNSTAVPLMLDAIRKFKATGKPLLAHADFCASAAYWIAAQCDAVYCDNAITSEVGSIGAYTYFIDDREALEKSGQKVHEIYAEESSDKNLAYRQALTGEYTLIRMRLSHLVAAFHADVKAGRPSPPGRRAGSTDRRDFLRRQGYRKRPCRRHRHFTGMRRSRLYPRKYSLIIISNMKLNWNFISKIFARTVGVENLSRDAEGHEVLSADQRKILEQKFGPEALRTTIAYAASDANDDAQQEQLLLNFLDAIGRSGGDDKDKLRQERQKQKKKSRRCLPR